MLACVLWGYPLNSGDINSVWTLFGVSNQLMASIGLMIGATIILRLARKRNATLSNIMLVLGVVIMLASLLRWKQLLQRATRTVETGDRSPGVLHLASVELIM